MRTQNLVPDVYYKESRDFSYIGRLLEVLFNYSKTNTDLVKVSAMDKNIPSSLIDLLATTVGFESKHEYITSDLIAICSAFSYLLRNKGSLRAIEDAIYILLYTQGITYSPDIYYLTDNTGHIIDRYHLVIEIPAEIKDVVLLEDLFEYILPVGFTYNFIYVKGDSSRSQETAIEMKDLVSVHQVTAMGSSQISGDDNYSDEDYNNRSQTYSTFVVGEDKQ